MLYCKSSFPGENYFVMNHENICEWQPVYYTLSFLFFLFSFFHTFWTLYFFVFWSQRIRDHKAVGRLRFGPNEVWFVHNQNRQCFSKSLKDYYLFNPKGSIKSLISIFFNSRWPMSTHQKTLLTLEKSEEGLLVQSIKCCTDKVRLKWLWRYGTRN